MDPAPKRLSAPELPRRLPRELSSAERRALEEIADVLIPAKGELPKGSDAPGFQDAVDRALLARVDSFDAILAAAVTLASSPPGELDAAVRRFSEQDPVVFGALSSVLAGAYLTVPEVRQEIGYPGQERRFARFDEAAEQIMDGILDPVIERGPIYQEP